MRHTHDDDRLTFGCPGCIHDRERDQVIAEWADMTDDELLELWYTADLKPGDDALLGRRLVERCILSIEEVEATGAEVA